MEFIWHIILIISILLWPVSQLIAKKYKSDKSLVLLNEVKNKVKTKFQVMLEKEIILRKTYPDYTRIPLKSNMNWMRILKGVEKKDRVLKRKKKEVGLGEFDVRAQKN